MIKFFRKIWNKVSTIRTKFSEWLNKDSKIEQTSTKVKSIKNLVSGGTMITLFCYVFTWSYFDVFGINYFSHFEYTDIYNFTLGRFNLFTNLILLTSTIAIMFGGFFIEFKTNKEANKQKQQQEQNKQDEQPIFYFSKRQAVVLWLMVFPYVLITSLFIYQYSNSFENALQALGVLGIAILCIYLHQKAKHDIFLILLIIIVSMIGIPLGQVFAGDRFKSEEYINLVNVDGDMLLKKSQIVIGQNKNTFIIIDKNDSIVEFISKSKVDKVKFKGNLKIKEK